jgi:hypothetical protein
MDRIRKYIAVADAAAVRVEQFLQRCPWLFPACLCLVLILAGARLAQGRLFWFDEIGTVLTLRSMARQSIFEYLRSGGDVVPPLYFLCAKLLVDLTGEVTLMGRYLAVGSTCLTVGVLFILMRRWVGVFYACLSTLFFLHTMILAYLSEGRPYSFVVLFAVLAVLAWDGIDGRRRYLAIVGMALAVSFALSLHYYAVFLLFPLGAGQLARDFARRKIDISVWLGLISPLAVLGAHIPLIRTGQAIYGNYAWQKVNLLSLADLYRALVNETGVLILLFLLCQWLLSRWLDPVSAPGSVLSVPILALLTAMLLIPVVAYTAGYVTGMFPIPRYVIVTVLAIAITPVYLMAHWRTVRPLVRVAVLLLAILSLGRTMRNEYRTEMTPPVSFSWLRQNLSPADGPVLIADAVVFLQLNYYRVPEKLPEILLPDSIELYRRYTGEDSGIVNLIAYRANFPEISLYPWERPRNVPWRFQVLRKQARNSWILTESIGLGGSARLLRAGEGWELFAVEIPAP